MGMVIGEWSFAHLPSLTIKEVANTLRSQMQLEVLITDEQRDSSIYIPLLRERLIRLKFETHHITVCTIAPENPYVWSHLDFLMRQYGGSLPDLNDPDAISWQPHPRAEKILRSWNELTWQQRFILKHPVILILAKGIFEHWLYPFT